MMASLLRLLDDWILWLLVVGVFHWFLAALFALAFLAAAFMQDWPEAWWAFGRWADAFLIGFLALGWRKAERGSVL